MSDLINGAHSNDDERMAQYKKDMASAEAALNKLQDAIDNIDEAQLDQLKSLNNWVAEQGFCQGALEPLFPQNEPPQGFDIDLVWREGLGNGHSQPLAVLLNRDDAFLSSAIDTGFLCFSSVEDFQDYSSCIVID